MKTNELQAEIAQSLNSAFDVLLASQEWVSVNQDTRLALKSSIIRLTIDACAANLAQGLAWRTLSESVADAVLNTADEPEGETHGLVAADLMADGDLT